MPSTLAMAAGITFALSLLLVSSADASCHCHDGNLTQKVKNSFTLGALDFLGSLAGMKRAYHSAPTCQQNLWRETFTLCAAWEGNHEALNRYTKRNTSLETYFVMPASCQAEPCVDHRVDWAKNALLDAVFLMEVAYQAVKTGRDPSNWLTYQELLGNLQEIIVDYSLNDNQWIYCPTSYNPVAPWKNKHNNMTWLPQAVWIDLPKAFTDIAQRLNCSWNASEAPSLGKSPKPQPHAESMENAKSGCEMAIALVDMPFGRAAGATDALVERQIQVTTPAVLAGFESKPPPLGTFDGLRVMLQSASEAEFRNRSDVIFNALLGTAPALVV